MRRVRRGIDAWNQQDLEALTALLAPEVVWYTAGAIPDLDATYEGREGVGRFFSRFIEPWRTIEIEIERVIDEREGQIVLQIRFRAEGREGVKVDMPYFHVYRFDQELRLRELRAFTEEADARREAALRVAESGNARIAREAMGAFSRGDLEEGIATLDPEIEWHLTFRLPDLPPGKSVFHGHGEVRELWRAFRSVWDELVIDWEEVEDEAPGMLIVRVRFRGRGGTSGIEVDRTIHYLLELENGLLRRIRPFDQCAAARAAAGLDDE